MISSLTMREIAIPLSMALALASAHSCVRLVSTRSEAEQACSNPSEVASVLGEQSGVSQRLAEAGTCSWWCAGKSQGWKEKCNWQACGGCEPCALLRTCEASCSNNDATGWRHHCNRWQCSQCAECTTLSVVTSLEDLMNTYPVCSGEYSGPNGDDTDLMPVNSACKVAEGYLDQCDTSSRSQPCQCGYPAGSQPCPLITIKRTNACMMLEPCSEWNFRGSTAACSQDAVMPPGGTWFDATDAVARYLCGVAGTWRNVLANTAQLMLMKTGQRVHFEVAGRHSLAGNNGTYLILDAHGNSANSIQLCRMKTAVQVYLCNNTDSAGSPTCDCQDAAGNRQLIIMNQEAALTYPTVNSRQHCGQWFTLVTSTIQAVMTNVRSQMITHSTFTKPCIEND